jgi:hypothetical protein
MGTLIRVLVDQDRDPKGVLRRRLSTAGRRSVRTERGDDEGRKEKISECLPVGRKPPRESL